jgi:hypothetical protein
MRTLSLLAATALAATAVPASATITWSTNQALGQGQTVQLADDQTVSPGDTLVGYTNQTNTQINFTSTQTIDTQSAGQADIFGDAALLTNLTFGFADPLFAATYLEFNLFEAGGGPNGATATGVTLTGIDDLSNPWTQTFTLSNGENFFSALASDNELITGVSFTTSGGGVTDFRQLRIDVSDLNGNSVPEPATWAMMLLGFGAIGVSIRRSRRKTQLVSQIA